MAAAAASSDELRTLRHMHHAGRSLTLGLVSGFAKLVVTVLNNFEVHWLLGASLPHGNMSHAPGFR
jgi:hypothetical protein